MRTAVVVRQAEGDRRRDEGVQLRRRALRDLHRDVDVELLFHRSQDHDDIDRFQAESLESRVRCHLVLVDHAFRDDQIDHLRA